ncbi:prepilin-type N-terminal cleavage/methylation domain-containing protein [Opitutaceae bacterium TAV4]|nr:prepilin-type N-terminal cleavage/methylation domain-containing protein [Opitutaceae bacterium TAV4]RRK01077.1 prepilin-type N-terminal cleavage/methylation domain-containing protein [Opitutaceae bacterium TAV3]
MKTNPSPNSRHCATHRARRHAFTLIELLTVIAIIGILAAILIPTVSTVRKTARKAECISNLRQLYGVVILHVHDNKDFMPIAFDNVNSQGWRWRMTEDGYLDKNTGITGCPEQRKSLPATTTNPLRAATFSMNRNLCISPPFTDTKPRKRYTQIATPSRTLLISDGRKNSDGTYNETVAGENSERPSAAHGDDANLLYADGHVSSVKISAIPSWNGDDKGKIFWRGE